jgi:hypothetical protein
MQVVKHSSTNSVMTPHKSVAEHFDQDVPPAPITKTRVRNMPAMKTYWKPTEVELANLLAGGHVVLTVFGNQHPPVTVTVEM